MTFWASDKEQLRAQCQQLAGEFLPGGEQVKENKDGSICRQGQRFEAFLETCMSKNQHLFSHRAFRNKENLDPVSLDLGARGR